MLNYQRIMIGHNHISLRMIPNDLIPKTQSLILDNNDMLSITNDLIMMINIISLIIIIINHNNHTNTSDHDLIEQQSRYLAAS